MTRSRVKQEQVDVDEHDFLADTASVSSPLPDTQQSTISRAVTVPSTMSPSFEPQVSSGDTTIADDVDMMNNDTLRANGELVVCISIRTVSTD